MAQASPLNTAPLAPAFPRVSAIVVAAGKGLRAGQPIPKQFASWRGKPVLRHSVEALIASGLTPVIVVIPEGADAVAAQALSGLPVTLVTGGAARQESVRAGLEALAAYTPDLVLIHDAARPGLRAPVIARLIGSLGKHTAAIPVLPVADSMLLAEGGMMAGAADRSALRRVQTPQAFRFPEILAAHRGWRGKPDAGDDAQVARRAGLAIALVEGDEALHKLTYETDFAVNLPAVRIGTGYDVHRLTEGRDLWLCGVKVEHTHGLAGHSDADVAIHALVDAILGAAGAGDIGQHFPPSDQKWAGASSDQFLRHAIGVAAEAGYALGNADVTIVCEAPKIGPHRETMRTRLAEIIGTDLARISVKATTTEGLDAPGRREGIAAHAVATLERL
jgi:2-C-methyl-D-erythritol 4-phosphate cytidylyltransferase/2-C-methyl-D-erythritol 2,4-cyclodiphosphate synthase